MTKNSAASFVDQINAEYREVVKAESSALPHAINCGNFLKLAKENLKADNGGKWLEWLKINCPNISQETASLYMRLAEHKAKVAKASSIREAQKLLPKKAPRGSSPSTNQASTQAAVDPPATSEPSTRTFEDQVEAFDANEVLDMLVKGWHHDDDKLKELAKLIDEYLKEKWPSISNTVANPTPALPPSPTPVPAQRRL
jgi:hypothetical protein